LYLWEPFNRPDHSLSLGHDSNEFNKDESSKMIVSAPKQAKLDSIPHVVIQYTMHRTGKDATILAGLSVISISGFCPPFEACPNRNLFQHSSGSNSILPVTLMFVQFQLLSLNVASTSSNPFSTASPMKNIGMIWTH
jgi:hypothetical protein